MANWGRGERPRGARRTDTHLQLGQSAEVVEFFEATAAEPEHAQAAERGAQVAQRRQAATVELELLQRGQPLPKCRDRDKL